MGEKNQNNESHDDESPGVIFPPPLILLTFLAAGALLQFIFPLALLAQFSVGSPQFFIGLAIILSGIGLAIWGVRTFSKAGTNVATHKAALLVVVDGPYKFTRNPMYMGMQILLVGVGIMFSSEWFLLLWPVFFLILRFGVVAREERYMRDKFGEQYVALLNKTRRWI
ncbi:MAG: isoprenylcysteine carboxylmethyltransferase family protein [Devosiaceae bacterium]|nr:isoprenylcysteine carboxylmethyltransferase family protein [Devosiaceae bacterium]